MVEQDPPLHLDRRETTKLARRRRTYCESACKSDPPALLTPVRFGHGGRAGVTDGNGNEDPCVDLGGWAQHPCCSARDGDFADRSRWSPLMRWMAPLFGCLHSIQHGTFRCRKREPSTPSVATCPSLTLCFAPGNALQFDWSEEYPLLGGVQPACGLSPILEARHHSIWRNPRTENAAGEATDPVSSHRDHGV